MAVAAETIRQVTQAGRGEQIGFERTVELARGVAERLLEGRVNWMEEQGKGLRRAVEEYLGDRLADPDFAQRTEVYLRGCGNGDGVVGDKERRKGELDREYDRLRSAVKRITDPVSWTQTDGEAVQRLVYAGANVLGLGELAERVLLGREKKRLHDLPEEKQAVHVQLEMAMRREEQQTRIRQQDRERFEREVVAGLGAWVAENPDYAVAYGLVFPVQRKEPDYALSEPTKRKARVRRQDDIERDELFGGSDLWGVEQYFRLGLIMSGEALKGVDSGARQAIAEAVSGYESGKTRLKLLSHYLGPNGGRLYSLRVPRVHWRILFEMGENGGEVIFTEAFPRKEQHERLKRYPTRG